MAFEFKFPDVGEGIHEGEIVRWRVAVGDEVKEDQPLMEMETAKAIVELPSPRSGRILALHGKEGEIVKVGMVLVEIEEKGDREPASARREREASEGGSRGPRPSDAELKKNKSGPGVIGEIPTDAGGIVLPPRRAETATSSAPSSGAAQKNSDQWGPIEHMPLKSMRKAIAQHMVKSAFTIPHVTHMDEVDASALMKLRNEQKAAAEKQGIKLTFLPYIIRAVAAALKKYPALNATFNERAEEITYKKYYSIGIAVDTPEGLMVPVIKNADQKDIFALAKEIAELAEKCRNRKIEAAELQGGTFTITNVGSVGGIFATPIISYGQTGNLGVFRIKDKPVVVSGRIEGRPMLTLAISFDHRALDGAEAARFMNELVAGLESIENTK